MPVNDLVRQRLQPLTSLVTSNRIALYCLLSVLLLVGTIANACRNYSNFYSVTIYLSKSSRSVLVRVSNMHISRARLKESGIHRFWPTLVFYSRWVPGGSYSRFSLDPCRHAR